ncbi:secretory lipase-domain-containing protein [Scheffersomyces xylosifermentans]|uniref:secretory lipase-domain-containing protein n=1 Tax=Scheffersomyces xylosifermentans TaxID=1304137 RepID=UPI00315C6DD8
MKPWLHFVIFSVFFCQIVLAAPTAKVLKPNEDPFYVPPEGYEDAEPGTILKSRKAPHMLRSVYLPVNVKNAWQLMVRSEGSQGNATAIVTTVIEPYNADPSKLVSYQVAEDAASANCAMSYALLFGASMDTIIAQVEMYFIQGALEQGWYVVVPDYEGPHASFTAGRQAGHAVLDSLRATLASTNITGVQEDAEVVLWGYSGGSLASGWAAALQPDYAPEVGDRILGAALGGFVTNITTTAVVTDNKLFAGLIPSAINGLMQEYPSFGNYVRTQIRPGREAGFLKASQLCMAPSLLNYAFDSFFVGNNSYFTKGLGILSEPIVKNILDQNTLALKKGIEVPKIPLFVYHGELDDVVPHVGAQRAFDNWCEWGIESFEFSSDILNGHITEFFLGAPAALTWISERFAGKPTVKGCKKTERLNNLMYPGVPESLKIFYESAYESVLGKDVGPNVTARDLANLSKRQFTFIDSSNLKIQT